MNSAVAARSIAPPKRREPSPTSNVPEGDVRLSVNISAEHRDRLKDVAYNERTTMGEIVEWMIDHHLDDVRRAMMEADNG